MAITPRPHRIRTSALVVALVLVLLTILAVVAIRESTAPDRAAALLARVPDLDPDLAHHLVASNDEDLARFCADHGAQWLIDAAGQLTDGLDASTLPAFSASLDLIAPPMVRVSDLLADRGHTEGPRVRIRHLLSVPVAQAFRETRHRYEADRLFATRGLPTERKYELVAALADSLATCPAFAASVESRLVELAADARREQAKLTHLHRGIALARESGLHPLHSQLLGTLCDDRMTAGQIDTAMILASEALEIALAARLPAQAARVNYLLASYYRDRGEISLASEYLEEAVAVARRFDATYAESQFLMAKLRLQAGLGCWDLVGRELPRLEFLIDEIPPQLGEPLQAIWKTEALQLRAGFFSHTDDFASADSAYAEACRLAASLPRNYPQAEVLAVWSDWLVERGQYDRGVQLADGALAYVRRERLHRFVPRLHATMARGEARRGDLDRAQAHLDSLAAYDHDDRYTAAVLALEIARLQGDRDAAMTAANEALGAMVADLTRWGSRVESYLMLQRHDELREDLHGLVGDGDREGLVVELGWRGLRSFARGVATGKHGSEVAAFLDAGQRAVEDACAWTRNGPDGLLVYATVGNRLERWEIHDGSVRRGTFPVTILGERIQDLSYRLAAAATAPTASLTPELIRHLRAAAILLPAWTRDDPPGRLLLAVCPLIEKLPLEALNLADDGSYLPLAGRWQTGYWNPRGVAIDVVAVKQASVVVGIPAPTSAARRRHPSLQMLPEVTAEARRAAAVLPGAQLIVGGDAQKVTVASALEGSRVIYIAGHTTHDPEMPYRTFLPCAVDPDQPELEHARLGFGDILGQDLAGCELVVLSSCRSAAGRITATAVGPSLADPFLDAGAAGVLATRWSIADADAAAFMTAFVDRWRGGTLEEAWAALTVVRREHVDQSGAALGWLAYELEFGRLP